MITGIWVDGEFFDHQYQHPLKRYLNYSAGAFEYIKIHDRKIFKLERYIKRLFVSAAVLSMEIKFSIDQIMQACIDITLVNDTQNGHLHLLVFPSYETDDVHVIISYLPNSHNDSIDTNTQKFCNLEISTLVKSSPKYFPYSVKIGSLLTLNSIAKKNAMNNGFDDAILLDRSGNIAGGTSANFFLVKDSVLYTPTIEFSLNGIMRQAAIEIANLTGIEVVEKHISIAEMSQADEIFLTSTLSGVTAVSSVGEYKYGENLITNLMKSKLCYLMGS